MLSNLVSGITKVGEGFDGEINEPIDIHFHKLLGSASFLSCLPFLIEFIDQSIRFFKFAPSWMVVASTGMPVWEGRRAEIVMIFHLH
jgi:hypothetical protein